MPRTANPPTAGERFFARILAARLECPQCGFLDEFTARRRTKGQVGNPARVKGRKGQTGASTDPRSPAGFNPLTGRWQCPSCRRTFTLGLLAWPVAPGGPAGATLPRDQVPSYRQLAQLRAQGGGLWMREGLKRYRATGSNIAAGCTCAPGCHYTNAADPGCPLLGGDDG